MFCFSSNQRAIFTILSLLQGSDRLEEDGWQVDGGQSVLRDALAQKRERPASLA